jgi:hypothetical protein
MFTSQHEEWANPRIVALVELDMREMRLRIVLARKAIRERMLELEHSSDDHRIFEDAPDNGGLRKMKRELGI